MMIEAVPASFFGVPVFPMDITDNDGEWTFAEDAARDSTTETIDAGPVVINMVRASGPIEVVVDSGADLSVAPLCYANKGEHAPMPKVIMQDAQGKRIHDKGARNLTLEVETATGDQIILKERFNIANVSSVILSLGRLLRNGWNLASEGGKQMITRDGVGIPVSLRRNTLVLSAIVAAISLMDSGPLPPELEEITGHQGWHIMPSGLPVLINNNVSEVPLENSIWSQDDWAWVTGFIRKEPANRLPVPGDVWVQAFSVTTEEFEHMGRSMKDLDEEFGERHDVVLLFHVDEIPKNLLSEPGEFFKDPEVNEPPFLPEADRDTGEGVGGEIDDVMGERDVRGQGEEVEHDGKLDGVELSVDTPLKELRALCDRLGVAKSGSKNKVLKRLRDHREVMEKQLATEVAKQLYKEQDRDPVALKAPVLPSARQQELHAITHQPFAPWCPACVMGRSKQSPARGYRQCKPRRGWRGPIKYVLQIDYCYTFTRSKGEEVDDDKKDAAEDNKQEDGDGNPAEAQHLDYQDQHGLNLVACESTTGWILALPLAAKGTASLKRTTEALTRHSLLIAGGDEVVIQGDPEPSVRQVLNAFQACRTKLGLKTVVRETQKGSHASNGAAEKAVSTIRAHARTLKAELEQRLKIEISGHMPIYSWLLRHSSFIHNRFMGTNKGLTPHEIVFGRRYTGKLLVFGEQCIYYAGSRFKGDLQWRQGTWVGTNERNGAHIVLTEAGAQESRSIRRVPSESQWVANAVVAARGLPWSLRRTKQEEEAHLLVTKGAPAS